MGNIGDYLDWRGDISFGTDPFNEVDNLILAVLAYTDFEGVIPGPIWSPGSASEPPGVFSTVSENRSVGIAEAAERYFSLHSEEELKARETFYRLYPLLLRKVAGSKRFAGLRLSGYVNLVDPGRDLQMSAVTYEVGDGTWYLAFRGTDDTLAGWKEDFDLSYSGATVGQIFARNYLEATFGGQGLAVRVGGHSKGGNFAAYAAAFCSDSVKDSIIGVYSNDGPGFIESIADSPAFSSMLPRMVKIIPETSIIGILMSGRLKLRVVKSSESGFMQHDALSWEVLGNRFVVTDERSEESILFDETIKEWIHGVSTEDRKLFVDSLFGLFASAGVTTLDEYREHKLAATAAILKGFNRLQEEKRKRFMAILRKLVRSGVKVLKERIDDRLEDKIEDKTEEKIEEQTEEQIEDKTEDKIDEKDGNV